MADDPYIHRPYSGESGLEDLPSSNFSPLERRSGTHAPVHGRRRFSRPHGSDAWIGQPGRSQANQLWDHLWSVAQGIGCGNQLVVERTREAGAGGRGTGPLVDFAAREQTATCLMVLERCGTELLNGALLTARTFLPFAKEGNNPDNASGRAYLMILLVGYLNLSYRCGRL